MMVEAYRAPGAKSPLRAASTGGPSGVSRERRGSSAELTGGHSAIDTTSFGGLYIHSRAGLHCHADPFSAPAALSSPSYFMLTCIWRGVDRGEHTISRCPNKENWITPGLTSPGATPRLSVAPCCRGDRLGQTGDPCLAPGGCAVSLPRLPGNMTTYTRPCQTGD